LQLLVGFVVSGDAQLAKFLLEALAVEAKQLSGSGHIVIGLLQDSLQVLSFKGSFDFVIVGAVLDCNDCS
jgi:hypothetical protein